MPYIFYCQACDKEFTQMLHISGLEKGGIKLPALRQRKSGAKGGCFFRRDLQKKLGPWLGGALGGMIRSARD
jgi:hypothetical protein